MKIKSKIFLFLFSFILIINFYLKIYSEINVKNNITLFQNSQENKNTQQQKTTQLPRSYKDFFLGMKLENFLNIIQKVDYLYYEGKIDVSMYEVDKNIFKASIPPYIRKLIFFFYKEILCLFTFYYDNKYVNYFSRYKELSEKYGAPTSMDSERFIWEDDQTLIIFERTNVLKVIDKNFINTIKDEYKTIENLIKSSASETFDNF